MCLGGYVLLGVALTPLHPGTGRSPGAVDLPVQRDSFGIPLVYASSLKGALKSKCMRELGADECKCLFGGDVGEGQYGGGAVSLVDLVPLAFPAPSPEMGYVYITSPMLLSKALTILENVGGGDGVEALRRFIEKLLSVEEDKLPIATFDAHPLTIVSTVLSNLKDLRALVKDGSIEETISEVKNVFKDMKPLAGELPSRLVVLKDSDLRHIVDKVLLRITRTRLNHTTKTVSQGMLWTEEYIPYGTVFLTAVLLNPFTNAYCLKVAGLCKEIEEEVKDEKKMLEQCIRKKLLEPEAEKVKEALERASSKAWELLEKLVKTPTYVFIGGKETIGKGLIKFKHI